MQHLNESFNVNIRISSAHRPQGNGQTEIFVKTLKEKIRSLMFEQTNNFILPRNWDQTILHTDLQVVRCDPSVAHGYAPAGLLLGRKLVYPFELEKKDIDVSGTNLTQPLVDSLFSLHTQNFQNAGKKIKKYQSKMKQKYAKVHAPKTPYLRKGMKVQYRNLRDARRVGGSQRPHWYPRTGFHIIDRVNRESSTCNLMNPKTNQVLKGKKTF